MAGRGVQLFVRAEQQGLVRNAFASGLIPRLTNFRAVLPETVAIRRRSIRREFQEEAQILPGGGRRRWRRSRAFFDTPAPEKTLQRSGALLRSLMGDGANAIESYTERTATFGTTLPYAEYHRRGARITITAKMRGFMLREYGRSFRARKRTITLPVRGFGGPTPETRTEIQATILRYLGTGKTSGSSAP